MINNTDDVQIRRLLYDIDVTNPYAPIFKLEFSVSPIEALGLLELAKDDILKRINHESADKNSLIVN